MVEILKLLLLGALGSESCKLIGDLESPYLYEPFGYEHEDKVYAYNSCYLHASHCQINFYTYDTS